MSVDAIQKLVSAEEQAAQMLREAEETLNQQRADSQQLIEIFKEDLVRQEKDRQKEIGQSAEAEFQKISTPLIEKTQKEVEHLRNISPELKEKALKIIIDKVVK